MKSLEKIETVLAGHAGLRVDIERGVIIAEAAKNKEVLVAPNGALVTWTPVESTGRSPKDTVIVRRPVSEKNIDWDSPNNLAISESTFDMLFEDALQALERQPRVYVSDRVVGADSRWALPVKTITPRATSQLFAYNMFRPHTPEIKKSVFSRQGFTLVILPCQKLDRNRYNGRLRKLPDGQTSDMVVAVDLDRRLGIIVGSAYCGSAKKLIFTVMNYYLPQVGVLPLHCSANEGPDSDVALLLGLSGTGKTTLSADRRRALLGDDEHGWSDHGIANFENGCYAKLIDLDPQKEPEIFQAVFHTAAYREHGAIIENAMMYPSGEFDLSDDRFTPNSRASYPLSFLHNTKNPPTGGHPRTILFLTADAYGVIPPISILNHEQAMLWFLMGYTSKLAGTETGVVDPKVVFSRFFGEPFMPRNPDVYASMLGDKLKTYQTSVYLVNTGWTGGPYGEGKRMDIRLTRAMVHAALSGKLDPTQTVLDEIFKLQVPRHCPGIPDPSVLIPKNTWRDKQAYEKKAKNLAAQFALHFDKAYGDKGIAEAVAVQCPGK